MLATLAPSPYHPMHERAEPHPCVAECTHRWVYAYDGTGPCPGWHVMRACGCARVNLTCDTDEGPTLPDARRVADVLNRVYGL